MARGTRRGLVVWQLVLILLALGIAAFLLVKLVPDPDVARTSVGRTAEVAAEVVQVEPAQGGGSVVTYRYAVGGESFERQDERNDWYRPESTQVKACYDPSNPGDSELVPAGRRCVRESQ